MTTSYNRTTGGPAASQSLLDQMTAQAAAAAVSAAAAAASAVTASGYLTAVASSATNAAASAVSSQVSAVSAAAQAAAAAVSAAAALAVFSTQNTWTADQTFNATLTVNGAGRLQLKPGSDDCTYMELYARTADPSNSSGYMGYGASGATGLVLWNKLNGVIQFATNNVARWTVDPSGHLAAITDDAYDIGYGFGSRPRYAYLSKGLYTGGASGPIAVLLSDAANSRGTIGTTSSHVLAFITNNLIRWQIDASGHLVCPTDATFDIGYGYGSRPRTAYLATALHIGSTKVLGAQGAAVADATDAASAITQLNALLARCRAHGLIA